MTTSKPAAGSALGSPALSAGDGLEANLARLAGIGKERAALLIVDMQNDFVREDGSAFVPGTPEVVPNVRNLLTAWRDLGHPIVHVIRLYDVDGSNAEIGRRERIASGRPIVAPYTCGSQPVAELMPEGCEQFDPGLLLAGSMHHVSSQEVIMYKPRWGAFYRTSLEGHLRSNAVGKVIICGCNLPNCPRATAFEASERDLEVVVVADAVSQASMARLSDLRLIDVEVSTTAEILQLVKP